MRVLVITDWMGTVHALYQVPSDFSDADLDKVKKQAEYYNQLAALHDLGTVGGVDGAIYAVKDLNGDTDEEEEEGGEGGDEGGDEEEEEEEEEGNIDCWNPECDFSGPPEAFDESPSGTRCCPNCGYEGGQEVSTQEAWANQFD